MSFSPFFPPAFLSSLHPLRYSSNEHCQIHLTSGVLVDLVKFDFHDKKDFSAPKFFMGSMSLLTLTINFLRHGRFLCCVNSYLTCSFFCRSMLLLLWCCYSVFNLPLPLIEDIGIERYFGCCLLADISETQQLYCQCNEQSSWAAWSVCCVNLHLRASWCLTDFSKYEVNSDDDDLPFKCYLCRKAFVNPVITK